MAPQGLDVLFSNSRLEVGRNFMNKIWNASRFVQMNLEGGKVPEVDLKSVELDLPERWILSQLNQTAIKVNRQLDRFHFNEAAKAIYEFTWSDFCDWYIEIAKTRFYGEDVEKANVARAVSVHVIKGILRLLHPYAPFITEELWAHFRNENDADLIVTLWLNGDSSFEDKEADDSITLLKDIITAVRTIRSGMNVPPGKKADLVIRNVNGNKTLIESFDEIIRTLGKVDDMTLGRDLKKPDQSATAVVQKMELFVPLKGLIDSKQEYARLSKRLSELERHLLGVRDKLENKNFMNSAPANIIENEKKKLQDMTAEFELVKANLEMLQ